MPQSRGGLPPRRTRRAGNKEGIGTDDRDKDLPLGKHHCSYTTSHSHRIARDHARTHGVAGKVQRQQGTTVQQRGAQHADVSILQSVVADINVLQ